MNEAPLAMGPGTLMETVCPLMVVLTAPRVPLPPDQVAEPATMLDPLGAWNVVTMFLISAAAGAAGGGRAMTVKVSPAVTVAPGPRR